MCDNLRLTELVMQVISSYKQYSVEHCLNYLLLMVNVKATIHLSNFSAESNQFIAASSTRHFVLPFQNVRYYSKKQVNERFDTQFLISTTTFIVQETSLKIHFYSQNI